MKTLCLGMGRNGTESLCLALTMLGIPTYHGVSTPASWQDRPGYPSTGDESDMRLSTAADPLSCQWQTMAYPSHNILWY